MTINRILSAMRLSAPRAPTGTMSSVFKDELRRFFEPEVEKLEGILGRDLSAWKKPIRS